MALATAIPVTNFLSSLGVNTRLEYTDGAYASAAKVVADLNYLGIHNLREGTPNPTGGIPYQNYLTSLHTVAAAGNKFDFVTSVGQTLTTSLQQIDAIATAHPGSVIAVEGPNEINNWPVTYKGLAGNAAAEAFQRDLYTAVHGDPRLSGAAVYYFTGGAQASSLAGLADYANAHPYPYQGQQPGARLAQEFASDFSMGGAYPKVITETGYYDQPSNPDGSGVDDATQAKNTLNLLLDAYKQGVSTTYLYQLLSAYPDNGTNVDVEYGLFRLDNSPKPVATAIHNLTTVLSDTGGTSFQPHQLNYTVSGLPANGNTMLLEKSSGIFDLMVWAEPQDWNESTHTAIAVSPSTVTVGLGATYKTVNIYDPTQSASPIKTLSGVSSVQLGVTDHPLIIEINPATVTSPSITFIKGPTVGTGIHTLAVYLSEDAYLGDAKTQIAINGKNVFSSAQAVTARQGLGQQEIFTINGNWTTPPTVAVSFLNDAWAGTPSTDRNLYITGAKYDGVVVPSAPHALFSAGTQTFIA